jgi:hypothetical protein
MVGTTSIFNLVAAKQEPLSLRRLFADIRVTGCGKTMIAWAVGCISEQAVHVSSPERVLWYA